MWAAAAVAAREGLGTLELVRRSAVAQAVYVNRCCRLQPEQWKQGSERNAGKALRISLVTAMQCANLAPCVMRTTSLVACSTSIMYLGVGGALHHP